VIVTSSEEAEPAWHICDNGPVVGVPQSHRDLLDAEFATLATLAADGAPQLTEVWFLYEDGEIKLSLNSARVKTKNLIARPQCSLFVLDLANPYRYVDLRGRARIEPDDDYAFADRVGAKYDSDLREHDGPGETRIVATLELTDVFAIDLSR
jgi:PPOX class probable F420-dependent enzyme